MNLEVEMAAAPLRTDLSERHDAAGDVILGSAVVRGGEWKSGGRRQRCVV